MFQGNAQLPGAKVSCYFRAALPLATLILEKNQNPIYEHLHGFTSSTLEPSGYFRKRELHGKFWLESFLWTFFPRVSRLKSLPCKPARARSCNSNGGTN